MRPLALAAAIHFGLAAAIATPHALAGPEAFHPGKLIPEYGMIADVPDAAPMPPETTFKLAIDVTDGGKDGEINGRFNTAASFLNLQHAAGIAAENVDIALVVHGTAYRDLLTDAAYGGENPNAELIKILQSHGVQFYYCGQAAAGRDVAAKDLLPGVEISPSATTTHVLLQQKGFALRP